MNTLIHSYCPAIALDSCVNDKRRDQKELSVFYAALGLQYPDGLSPEHAAACWLREIAYLAQLRKGAGGLNRAELGNRDAHRERGTCPACGSLLGVLEFPEHWAIVCESADCRWTLLVPKAPTEPGKRDADRERGGCPNCGHPPDAIEGRPFATCRVCGRKVLESGQFYTPDRRWETRRAREYLVGSVWIEGGLDR